MLKQSTCTAYVNVQQKVHRTAQLSHAVNKQIRTSPAPRSFPCATRFTTKSASYLANEDTVGQGLSTCTTRRVCRDRDRWQVPQFRVVDLTVNYIHVHHCGIISFLFIISPVHCGRDGLYCKIASICVTFLKWLTNTLECMNEC